MSSANDLKIRIVVDTTRFKRRVRQCNLALLGIYGWRRFFMRSYWQALAPLTLAREKLFWSLIILSDRITVFGLRHRVAVDLSFGLANAIDRIAQKVHP